MADNPSVAAPSSGTYGEKEEINELKASLPQGAIGTEAPAPQAPPISPEPVEPKTIPVGRPSGPPAPPGVPSVLLRPTERPNVPVNTPLTAPATPAVADPRQARMAVLDALANSDTVAPETREWAQNVIEALLGG